MQRILFFLSETPFPPYNGFRTFSYNILIRISQLNQLECIEIESDKDEFSEVSSISQREYRNHKNIKKFSSLGIKRQYIPKLLRYFLNTIMLRPTYLNFISKKKRNIIQKNIINFNPNLIIIDSQSFGLNFAMMKLKHNSKVIILQRDTHSLSLYEQLRNKLYSNLFDKYFQVMQMFLSRRVEKN